MYIFQNCNVNDFVNHPRHRPSVITSNFIDCFLTDLFLLILYFLFCLLLLLCTWNLTTTQCSELKIVNLLVLDDIVFVLALSHSLSPTWYSYHLYIIYIYMTKKNPNNSIDYFKHQQHVIHSIVKQDRKKNKAL